MPTLPSTAFHVDLALARSAFERVLLSSANEAPIRDRVLEILGALGRRGTDENDYYFHKTDDEPGVARLLASVLALVLHEPDDVKDSDIAVLLVSLLSCKRWAHLLDNHDAFFHLVCAFVFATERFEPVTIAMGNLYRALLHTMADAQWPFPEHQAIDPTRLADGRRPVIQELCDGALGPVWWQVAAPAPDVSCVFDVLLNTRPQLLNFACHTEALDLPPLPDHPNMK